MELDVLCEDPRWAGVDLEALTQRAADAALAHLGVDGQLAMFSVLGCDDARISVLNGEFRGKPSPTNVLSWPSEDLAAAQDGGAPQAPVLDYSGYFDLGDIAISFDTCTREAEAAGKPFADHVCHLIVHGLLHLLGYDHIRDLDATLMEHNETVILGKLGLDDPYRS